MKNKLPYRITHQDCANLMRHRGYSCPVEGYVNAPYRDDSEKKMHVAHNLWYDFVTGEGGHVVDLARKMVGPERCYQVLCAAMNYSYEKHRESIHQYIDNQAAVSEIFTKVQNAFPIASAPDKVRDYLTGRRVTHKTEHYLSYIPDDIKLSEVLSVEEKFLSGIEMAIGKVILWYPRKGRPAYYCCRDIETKAFLKGKTYGGQIENPIWNADVLYEHPNVVWGEGMFDVLSLMELDYGVCGEITCHAIKSHFPELLIALRWRQKMHPDWRFTICLDDDEVKADGSRPGNDAAQKLALKLFTAGIDCHWVKHDTPPGSQKVDINDLHKAGKEADIIRMIDNARPVSELLEYDEKLFIRVGLETITNNPLVAKRVLSVVKKHCGEDLASLYQSKFIHKIGWREVYDPKVKHIWQNNDGIHVEFSAGEHPVDNDMKTYPANRFVEAMSQYQRLPVCLKLSDLDIDEMTSVYIVSREKRPYVNAYNIFTPSDVLAEELDSSVSYDLPPMWNLLLSNLAGKEEKEYLLNHLACYFQTFQKPLTIPVLTGNFGTGKNTFFEIVMNRALGRYRIASNNDLLSGFDDWMQNTPCIIIDELEKLHPTEQPRVDAKLRSLINETQNLRIKHKNNQQCGINAYIAILCNSNPQYTPMKVRRYDRRYCIIGGGTDRDLNSVEGWSRDELIQQCDDFIRYLRARPIDVARAAVPLKNSLKDEMIDMSSSPESVAIRHALESVSDTDVDQNGFIPLKVIIQRMQPRFNLDSKRVRRIMADDLGYVEDRYWGMKNGVVQFRIGDGVNV